MALTREEVIKAFWEAAKMENEGIPPEDEIDYTFSQEYCERRESLIELVGKMEGITDIKERDRILKQWKKEMDRKYRR